MGKPLGMPKTGVFGLLDLVGLDLDAAYQREPRRSAAAERRVPFGRIATSRCMRKMIEEGYTGRKGKGGFYRHRQEQGPQGQAG